MPEYKLKARIQNKYKTLAEWNAIAAGEFIPLLGEVCYAVEDGVLLQKIGDGTTDFTKLEWLFCYAPQADHNENDVSSPAYIKNRLGYVDLENVPEKEQELFAKDKKSGYIITERFFLNALYNYKNRKIIVERTKMCKAFILKKRH